MGEKQLCWYSKQQTSEPHMEDLDMATKETSYVRNWISSKSSTNKRDKANRSYRE